MSGNVPKDELIAGVGREEISPPIGFPHTTIKDARFDSVLTPLYARALVLGFGTAKVAVLQWDLVTPHRDATAKARRLVSAATGILERNILIHVSHSHSAPRAPCNDATQFPMGEHRTIPAGETAVLNQQWSDLLFSASVAAAETAIESLQPVSLEIGRASVPECQFNRRPRRPDGTVETILVPTDPSTMPDGLRFGPMEPTLTVLVFKDSMQRPVSTVFSYPCHGVCVYSLGIAYKPGAHPKDFTYVTGSKAASPDWPGYAADQIESILGGRAIFLQGCAGDENPPRRGIEAAKQIGAQVGVRAAAAANRGSAVNVDRLETHSSQIGLPLNPGNRAELGRDLETAEVQAFVMGPVAIVALPGEPMIQIAVAIQERSPYPHTIVLGYSNGNGVGYVGIPGELGRGGYGTGVEARGTDECGTSLIDTSLRLLREIAAR